MICILRFFLRHEKSGTSDPEFMIAFRSAIDVICNSMKVHQFKSDIQNIVLSLALLNAFTGHIEPLQKTEVRTL